MLIQERICEKIVASDIIVFPLSKTRIKIAIKKVKEQIKQGYPQKKTRWLF
jgi:predicted KAP-like P-loop ATPase